MKPLSDPQLNRLLAGRDALTQADKDAALEQVLEKLPAEPPAERPAGLLAPWLRWAMVGLCLVLLVPVGYRLLSNREDQFTARGPADDKPSFAAVCAATLAEGKCAAGGKLLFRVEPRGATHFASLSIGNGGAVVWYFADVGLENIAADGLLSVGVPLGPEHPAGRYDVVGVFADRALTKDEVRTLLEAPEKPSVKAAVVHRALEVTP